MKRTNSPAQGLIKSRDLRDLCGGISQSTERRWLEEGVLPAPLKIRGQKYYYLSQVGHLIDEAWGDGDV